MIGSNVYRNIIIPLILAAGAFGTSYSQNCEMNMLVIPDANSYASVFSPPSLPSGALTIECWAKATSLQTGAALVEYGNAPASESFSLWFSAGQKITATLALDNGSVTVTGSSVSNATQWHHYAVTFNPQDSIRLFIDGTLVAEQATNATSVVLQPYTLYVGRSAITGISFVGDIDELRIWGVARTAAQITSTLTTPLFGNEAGLKLYYKFDDDPQAVLIHNFSGKGAELTKSSGAILDTSTSPIQGPVAAGYMLGTKQVSVTFNDLLCSDTGTMTIEIFNRGSEQIDLGSIGFQNGTYFSSASSSGFPLPPGDTTKTAKINIQVNVSKPGLYTDILYVTSSTVCGGQVQIPVQVRKDVVDVEFQDSIFNLYKQLNCNLPLTRSTYLRNTGTKPVTINSLLFQGTTPIAILSPATPFTIDTGRSQEVRFELVPGPATAINAILQAIVKECPVQATMAFIGSRVDQNFSVPSSVQFQPVHLPPVITYDTTTVLVQNTGTSTLYFTPAISLTGSGSFRLLSPVSGLVKPLAPDSILQVKIQFAANTDCGTFNAALTFHFQDNRDCPIDTIVPVSATVLGPQITTPSDMIDLGAGCFTRDTLITFRNQSGRQVLFGNPIFSQNNILSLQSPGTLPTVLNDGDSVVLHFVFAPSNPGEYMVNAQFPLSPCGNKMLTFHAIYGIGKFTSSDSVVDFGTRCDLSTQTKTVRIRNLVGRPVTVTDSTLALSSEFRLISPTLPFTFATGEEKTLTIQYVPIIAGVTRGEISLFDSGCYVTRIQAKAIREHAHIGADQSVVEFGAICPNDTSLRSIILTNLGHGAVTITSARIIGDNHFQTIADSVISLPSGGIIPIALQFIPSDTSEYVAILELVFGPCGDTVRYGLHGIGGPKPILVVSENMLDFGNVKIGDTASLCVTLTNPSCLPIVFNASSLSKLLSPFAYSSVHLSDTVTLSHPVQLCMAFIPTAHGAFGEYDTITSGGNNFIVHLLGNATAVDLKFPHIIDFGDVPVSTSKTLFAKIDNLGDANTSIKIVSQPGGEFLHTSRVTTGNLPTIETDSFRFTPTVCEPARSVYLFQWDNHLDSIVLIGRGVCAGPLFSLSTLDFGNVRVAKDSLVTVGISAAEGFPVMITGVTFNSAVFTISSNDKTILNNAFDTAHYVIKYSPIKEQQDVDSLILSTSSASAVSLPLRGTGVEAHLVLSDSIIDFGNVGVQKASVPRTFLIKNTGGYPLKLLSASTVNSVFGITDPFTVDPIAPHSSSIVTTTFTPQRPRQYIDSLVVTADAPEATKSVVLQGKGVFEPFGYPEITYSLPNIWARVGDIVDIPIEIGGPQYNLVAIDSFYIDITFDSTVIYIRSVKPGTVTAGNTLLLTQLSHSKIRVSNIKGDTLSRLGGTLCILRAEALLGPNDSTGLIIAASDPTNTAILQSSSGSFVVTDCGNYRGGILFKGNYSISPSTPNPTNGILTIPYELGIAAHVRIDLFDQLGRRVKTLLDADRGFGKHELVANISDLPSGGYYYTIESLEYHASQKLQLLK